jgi:hypothetical protein
VFRHASSCFLSLQQWWLVSFSTAIFALRHDPGKGEARRAGSVTKFGAIRNDEAEQTSQCCELP